MCKYAKVDVVEVMTKTQLQIITDILSRQTQEEKAEPQQFDFDVALWSDEDKDA